MIRLHTNYTHYTVHAIMECQLTLVLLLVIQFSAGKATMCPNTSAVGDTKPLYLLSLQSFPGGLTVLSGPRIARDEINNRSDILSDYHIELIVDTIEGCSSNEAGIGLSNLLKHTLNPQCRPVVAVAGLGCSSHTSVLSPIAGHDNYDLIQLSSANAPIFETENHRFPHLWRFLGSATVYSDAVLAIMDQFNWSRIGIVYNTGSLFHSEIAKYLLNKIKNFPTKKVNFYFGISGTREFYLETAVSNIKTRETTIIVSMLNENQTAAILKLATEQKVVLPHYLWIHIEKLQRYFRNYDLLSNSTFGQIFLHTQTTLYQEQTELVSGETFATFNKKHREDLELLKKMYNNTLNITNLNPSSFARYWYDQVWAIALAINNSLPVLEHRNLSIDEYTIGQPEVTAVIEEEMSKLSFQGAGGLVKFDQYHSVSTPVEVFQILDNGTQEHVGLYNSLNKSAFYVNISASDLPKDRLIREYVYYLIPVPGAIVLYILTGGITIFITVQLIFYLYYRDHKVIKATSPYLSLVMFFGCYLLCLSAIVNITIDSFVTIPTIYTTLFCLIILLTINGTSLVLITLFIKLLRVERIFSSRLEKDIGKCWSNGFLVFIVIFLTVIVNMMVVPVLVAETPEYSNYTLNPNDLVVLYHVRPVTRGNIIGVGIVIAYMVLFLLIISFLSIRTRKIRHRNFKDTKKINLLIALLIVISFSAGAVYIMLTQINEEPIANTVLVIALLSIPTLCQLILFTPKVVPVILEYTSLAPYMHKTTFMQQIKYNYNH